MKACEVARHQDVPLLGAGPASLDIGVPGDLLETAPPHLPVADLVDPLGNLPERLKGRPGKPPVGGEERWATREEIEGEGLVMDLAAPEQWESFPGDIRGAHAQEGVRRRRGAQGIAVTPVGTGEEAQPAQVCQQCCRAHPVGKDHDAVDGMAGFRGERPPPGCRLPDAGLLLEDGTATVAAAVVVRGEELVAVVIVAVVAGTQPGVVLGEQLDRLRLGQGKLAGNCGHGEVEVVLPRCRYSSRIVQAEETLAQRRVVDGEIRHCDRARPDRRR